MPEKRRPRKGSMGYWPRKRAKRIYPRLKTWVDKGDVKPLGFAVFKAGMTHVMIVDTNTASRTKGQLIQTPVTILDCPPVSVFGFRAYKKDNYSLSTISHVFADKFSKNLPRKFKIKETKSKESLKKIEDNIEKVSFFVLLCHTNPTFKKKPEVFEIKIGGKDPKEQLNFAKEILGKEIKVSDIFKEGDYFDTVSINKGKGYQGAVKRFGIVIQGRKNEQAHRHIGASGTKEPGKIRSTVPQAGQMGFHTRTEFNKRIIKIAKPNEVTPKGGLLRYGNLSEEVILMEGSVPGPTKRLIRLRFPVRPLKKVYPVDVKLISLISKQGA